MERLRIGDFVELVIRNVENLEDEQRKRLVSILLSQASIEDVKQAIREVANG